MVIRISAHVYNCMEDFELLDKAILELQHEANRDKQEPQKTKVPFSHTGILLHLMSLPP